MQATDTQGTDDDDETVGTSDATGHAHDRFWPLALGALGVVYGDIGTSPLYAMRECFTGEHGITPTAPNVYGVVSLVFWSLLLVISVKYLAFIMRADNRGEGGILALMALVGFRPKEPGRSHAVLVLLGVFGAALLYGDGIITPAISVLSAVEGLASQDPEGLGKLVLPLTCVILVGLFLVQRKGTGRVGAFFGPVVLLWFVVIAALGVASILRSPEILGALSPHHAVAFFTRNGAHGLLVLGAVFLVVTGGEALYADMGHFGPKPIRFMWFAAALPALLLNYLGQGALLLRDPSAAPDLFYRLAPSWALYPVVVLATAATVIASQALISAVFSLTRQAVQLGYAPRVHVIHTSSEEIGQIYVPVVNWALMVACLAVVLEFRSSSRLAAAYGIAVTMTMAITTILFHAVARTVWGWSRLRAGVVTAFFLVFDLAFFGANVLKIADGGWFPLAVALGVFFLLTTWKWGRTLLAERMRAAAVPLDAFLDDMAGGKVARVPGTAVFMSGTTDAVPTALLHNLKHNKVLHERNMLLTVTVEEIPHVPATERLTVSDLGHGFTRMLARYGFMEDPDVPALLELAGKRGLRFKLTQTTFFLGRETLVPRQRRGLGAFRRATFAVMSLNARNASSFFRLPPNRVVELGSQVEL